MPAEGKPPVDRNGYGCIITIMVLLALGGVIGGWGFIVYVWLNLIA